LLKDKKIKEDIKEVNKIAKKSQVIIKIVKSFFLSDFLTPFAMWGSGDIHG